MEKKIVISLKCPNCGASVSERQEKCEYCGSSISVTGTYSQARVALVGDYFEDLRKTMSISIIKDGGLVINPSYGGRNAGT